MSLVTPGMPGDSFGSLPRLYYSGSSPCTDFLSAHSHFMECPDEQKSAQETDCRKAERPEQSAHGFARWLKAKQRRTGLAGLDSRRSLSHASYL